MPYIQKKDRVALAPHTDKYAQAPGELNYQITKLCDWFLSRDGEGPSYTKMNEIVGVLECVKLEFYRRLAAPYEDVKQKENGDVYSEENQTRAKPAA